MNLRRKNMDLINKILKKSKQIDFLFPNSFEELMNNEYYDYDKFEWFLYYTFELQGAKVEKIGKKGQGDGGVDLILRFNNADGTQNVIGVQAKYWKNKVGVLPIQQLGAAKDIHYLTDLWLITTSDLTQDALAATQKMKVVVLRGSDVRDFIDTVKEYYNRDMREKGESPIVFLKSKQEKPLPKPKEIVDDNKEDDLVSKLKSFRKSLGLKYKLFPLFKVFTDKALDLIIELKPKTLEELRLIKGIPYNNISLFENELLEFINTELNYDYQAFYEFLIEERSKIATYNNIKEEEVYTDETAKEIAKKWPKTIKELELISGFSKRSIGLFGSYLIKKIKRLKP